MPVERVRINPDQIILRDSAGGIVFDTNRYYLKTDPNGQLKAGGYQKCPSIWGSSSGISDKDTGWYTSEIFSGTFFRNSYYYYYVPKSTNIKIVRAPYLVLPSASNTYYSPYKMLFFNSVNSGLTFRWAGGDVVIGSDGEGGQVTAKMAWIEFSPGATSNSGYYTFEPVDLSLWTRTITGEYGTTYTQTFKSSTEYDNGYGTIIQREITWAPFCIMTLSDPVTLSVAVTP